MLPQLNSVAQIAIAHVLNSFPEGFLVAGLAWFVLRLLPKQSSGTRFVVWLVTLLSIAVLPFIGTPAAARALATPSIGHSLLAFPEKWALVLFSLWLLALCGAMLQFSVGIWRLRCLRNSCITINPDELEPSVAQVLRDFSSSRSVTLASSQDLTVPAAIGFFKPTIVIPQWVLQELPPEELKVILLHESAHLRRWDDWTNLLQKIVRAVFFFHPAVWWIERRLSLEREMACDDQVVAVTGNPRGYAKCLVAIMERNFARRAWALAHAAVSHAQEATIRLARILDVNHINRKSIGKPAIGLVSVLLLLCLTLAPETPQLVTFVPATPAIHPNASTLPPFTESGRAIPTVIAAAMHVSTPVEKPQRPSTDQAAARSNLRVSTAPRVIAAKATTSSARVASVKRSHNFVSTETVFVIRAVGRSGPNSYSWSIRVWQVIWVPDQEARTPVAKTT
jgi:beta-lactamase regulating signal transducer with metallopeptidase domain